MGLIDPRVVQKPNLNPTQRALRHQLDRSPSYLKKLQLYLDNDLKPPKQEDC